MTNQTIPSFNSYAQAGDSIEWMHEGYKIKATLHNDTDTHVRDSDCYSREDVQRWMDSEWFYVGVILSVSYNGVDIGVHLASAWGLDCNYSATSNSHLSECAFDLKDEAIKEAKIKHKQMITVLTE